MATGVLADAFRVHDITYDGDATGPASCFVKVTKSIGEIAANCAMTKVYDKECYAFREMLPNIISKVIRVPKTFATHLHREEDGSVTSFCIVMEEMPKDQYTAFEQGKIEMSIEQVQEFFSTLAKLHASCWDFAVNDEQPGLGG